MGIAQELLSTGSSLVESAAVRTVGLEIKALEALASALSTKKLARAFDAAAALMLGAKGRVVVTGMGKSGLVARKIGATFASTGTPALFLHPADAGHGDLGMITADDVVLALSWSGETAELSDVITYCGRFDVPLVAMTARDDSSLSRHADIVMLLPKVQEACPHDLAPTSSTIVQMALGDALAIALIDLRGFSPGDFHVFHPRGRLGAQLLTVADLMSTGDAIPRVALDATILTATVEMSQKRFGVTAVIDDTGLLAGAFTDGDLRRSLAVGGPDAPVSQHMTLTPLFLEPDRLGSEAIALMTSRNISQLFACQGRELVGILHIHDVLRAGVI